MTEIMLDIETASVRPNAAILTIGAIKFSRKGNLKPLDDLDTFYRKINLDSCKKLKMHIDPGTEAWWKRQSPEALEEAFGGKNRVSLKQALVELQQFFRGCDIVWANGDDFDCVIVGEACRLCGLEIPWKFWNTRDCRTVMDLGNVYTRDLPGDGAHHAVHDCYRQIIGVKRALKNLGL